MWKNKTVLVLSVLVIGMVASLYAVNLVATSQQVAAEMTDPTTRSPESTFIGPHYEKYTSETVKRAQTNGRTFLLFWVPWCSSCSAVDAELEQRSGELPSNVTVLKVNMEQEKELVAKYGVSIQHTLVEIDASGTEIQKWVGGDFNTLTTHL